MKTSVLAKLSLRRSFTTTPAGKQRLSLDQFFSAQKDPEYTLTDEKALQYMQMAAELSLISRFKDEEEMHQYKTDF